MSIWKNVNDVDDRSNKRLENLWNTCEIATWCCIPTEDKNDNINRAKDENILEYLSSKLGRNGSSECVYPVVM